MNCKDIKHTITEISNLKVVDGIPKEIKSHLENCDSCKQFYDVSLHLNEFIQERKSADADDMFFSQVMKKVNGQEKTLTIRPQPTFLRNYRSVAASVIFILALGLGILAGKYSASTFTNSSTSSYQESTDILGLQVADNSYNLIKFDE